MKNKRSANPKAVVSLLLIILLCTVGAYIAFTTIRSYQLYTAVKGSNFQRTASIFEMDPKLSYRPARNVEAIEHHSYDLTIGVRHDNNGLRIPIMEEKNTEKNRPYYLFFGDSFTYGFRCNAEDAFPHKVATMTGGYSLNAGTAGYGLATILVRAEEDIPKYKPDIVVVQHSGWIVGRSTQKYNKTRFGDMPVPYFSTRQDGDIEIQPPLYKPVRFSLPFINYQGTSSGFSDFLGFIMDIGFPYHMYHDRKALSIARRWVAGNIQKPSQDYAGIVYFAYSHLGQLCKENGAELVILHLGASVKKSDEVGLFSKIDAILVDVHGRMLDDLKARFKADNPEGISLEEMYHREYSHTGGNPVRTLDKHPKPQTHSIIAHHLTVALKKLSQKN